MAKETAAGKPVIAVVDIGASAIRMVVAEVGIGGEVRQLENLHKPVKFGKDVFTSGKISAATSREGIAILKNYKSVLEGYGVKKIQAVATSALREAVNRENFIDQVYVRTGIEVEILEGAEENRLELIAVELALSGKVELEKKNALILEVGSGSSEMILLNQGRVEMARTLSLGAIRLPNQMMMSGKADPAAAQRALKKSIQDVVAYVAREYNIEQVDTLVTLGADMRFVLGQIQDATESSYGILEKKAFASFVNKISKSSPEELASQFNLPYNQAETLLASLWIYLNFLNETKVESVTVLMTSIRDALLAEMAQMLSGYKRTDVSKQVVSSAKHLAEKYRYEKAHASQVASLALKLFDHLGQDHGMGSLERLLLEVSSILHDVGMFISPSSHHKHSSYLVEAAELFGLRRQDKNIVSNVVRYHRGANPKQTHVAYMSLPKLDRATVSKLAAILRIADAMDHSHQQKIRTFTFEKTDDFYVLWVPEDAGDISLERDSIQNKGGLFADVFGAPIHLKQGVPPKKETAG